MPDNTAPAPAPAPAADPSASVYDLTALTPEGWSRTADRLTAPSGLTIVVGSTPRDGIALTAENPDSDQPLWWVIQTGGSRTLNTLIMAMLEAAAHETAPATFESMDQAIGRSGAGWTKVTSPSRELVPATLTQWDSPGGLRHLWSCDLEGLDPTGYVTGWHFARMSPNRARGRQWRASATTAEAVVCALALTSAPTCQVTTEMLETLSGLELSPAARTPNRMFVGARRTDSVLSRTLGSIEPESGRWVVRVQQPSGHEQRVPGTACCVQAAMAAVWTHRQV